MEAMSPLGPASDRRGSQSFRSSITQMGFAKRFSLLPNIMHGANPDETQVFNTAANVKAAHRIRLSSLVC